jgi:hypothetical protein
LGTVAPSPWYIETRKNVYHVWVVNMTKETTSIQARDENNIIQDEFSINN